MDDGLAVLCRSCGLCCDGSLFGRVALGPGEVAAARRHGLRIVEGGKGFEQPCGALSTRAARTGSEHVCSCYEERPRACRTFACRLYDRHRREGGPIDARLAAVGRVRQLVADLQALGLTPADFGGDSPGPPPPDERALRMHAELQMRLAARFPRA